MLKRADLRVLTWSLCGLCCDKYLMPAVFNVVLHHVEVHLFQDAIVWMTEKRKNFVKGDGKGRRRRRKVSKDRDRNGKKRNRD